MNVWGNFAYLMMIYPVFAWVTSARSISALIVGMTLLISSRSFILGSYSTALAESLPKSIRGSGFGIAYSVAIAVFGGTTQLIVTWLIHLTGSAMAPAWYLIGATLLGQIALMFLAESAPMRLARAQSAAALPSTLAAE
jgi:hypothetical protein